VTVLASECVLEQAPPQALAPILENVPAALRERPQWVVWQWVWKVEKWTKMPVNARTGKGARANDPRSWSSFEDACAAYREDHVNYAGIGFMFSADDGFAGIDLDDCVDESGTIAEPAMQIIRQLNTYAEVSPTGTGVKIFVQASKPAGALCKSTVIEGMGDVEVYDGGRYFTVTGHHVPGTPPAVEPCQPHFEDLCQRLWPPKEQRPNLRHVAQSDASIDDDDELLDRARNAKNGDDFQALFDRGDLSAHNGDDSRADLALCSLLAFWTARDAGCIDRLFRRSALYREKWERPDYRARTIDKAVSGCSDVFTPTQRQRAVKDAKSRQSIVTTPTQILIDTDEHRVADEAIEALQRDPDLYKRGNILSRVIGSGGPSNGVVRCHHAAVIQSVPTANLRDRLTRFASFFRVGSDGETKPAHPPAWLVGGVESRGDWPDIRPLVAIADAPFLRPDGSICQEPGYDRQTSVLLVPGAKFPQISAEVDADDAQTALMEVVCDFRFERDEHRAAWLAGLLTLLARHAFHGPTPLFLIDANVRGAGKGLLAQTIAEITQGGEMAVSSYSHEREEMRKKITTIAIAGDQMVLLDNLEGMFGNDALDRALTTTRWKDRILGHSEQVDLPLTAVWFATGNNVMIGADTTRRVIHIRLDVLEEHPEHRRDFRHPNLIPWIRDNRPRLLSAALTILAAYCRAGRPTHGLRAFGSFEGWSLIREAIVWLGLPDPCLTRIGLAEVADTTADILRQLITAWRAYDPQDDGVVIADMLACLYPSAREQIPQHGPASSMRRAIDNLMNDGGGRAPTAKKVGNRLKHYRRRVVDGAYLDVVPAPSGAGMVWRLVSPGGGS
jgi:hypothetical protein